MPWRFLSIKILFKDFLAGPWQTDTVPLRPRSSKLKIKMIEKIDKKNKKNKIKMIKLKYKMLLCLALIKKTMLTC